MVFTRNLIFDESHVFPYPFYEANWYNGGNGSFLDTYVNPYSSRIRTYYEFLDGEEGTPVSRPSWKDVQHYVQYVQPAKKAMEILVANRRSNYTDPTVCWIGSIPVGTLPYPSVFGSWEDPTMNSGMPKLYAEDSSGRGITTNYNPDVLITHAMRAMLPGVRPAILSLAELYQLKDLKPSLTRTLTRFTNPSNEIGRFMKQFRKIKPFGKILNYGRRILALPADLYLQWKFNIVPTVGDIVTTWNTLSEVHRQVERLLANANRKQKKHYSVPLYGNYPSVQLEEKYPGIGTEMTYPCIHSINAHDKVSNTYPLHNVFVTGATLSSNTDTAEFHAEVEFSYRYPDIEQKQLELLALKDYLGLGSNPVKDVWEIIPWSFAIDWLVNVSSWLDQFESTPRSKPIVVIHNWCWSHSVKRSIHVSAQVRSAVGAKTVVSDIPVLNVHESAYLRSTSGVRGWLGLQWSSGATQGEFALGSALFLTGSVSAYKHA
jgi:hypothetical protein